MLAALKSSKVILRANIIENEIVKRINKQINCENVTTYYQLARLFNLQKFAGKNFSLIERCFTKVVKTGNFLELDFSYVKIILGSSELDVTSELQVMIAANRWLNYDFDKRSQFAKDIFLAVRLPLLTDSEIRKSFEAFAKNSCLFVSRKTEECQLAVDDLIQSKKDYFKNRPLSTHKARYCNQDKFDIVVCGGLPDKIRNQSENDYRILKVDGENVNNTEHLTQFPNLVSFRAVNVCCEFYLLAGNRSNNTKRCHKYCFDTNT